MEESITRIVDELGRIVLPAKVREQCGIRPGDKVEVRAEGNGTVVLKKSSK
jgi:AbrB family looped-hinge helix DNA binding protein